MKIAMIGQKIVPSRLGGIEVAVESLAVRMAERGHKVTLYNCRRCSLARKTEEKRHGFYRGVEIREVRVPDIRGVSAMLGSVIAALRALFGRYDCIHFHAEGPALMSVIPHMFGIRTVVTIHGLDWKRSKWGGFASWYLKKGEKTAAAYADEIIVLSTRAQQYFKDTYGRDTVLIPNGIEKPDLRKPDYIRKKWGLEKDNYILYLGRIVPEKRLDLLIQAFRRTDTDKKLVIAGGAADTEPFYRKLKSEAESDSRIIFTGFVQGKILNELYSNSYLYCLPSELEGMPISLLEAMSYGNCCVCSDIPECAEVIRGRGFLFKSGSTKALRTSLQMLCDQPDLVREVRQEVRDHLFEEYDWEKITDRTLQLYRKKKISGRRKH